MKKRTRADRPPSPQGIPPSTLGAYLIIVAGSAALLFLIALAPAAQSSGAPAAGWLYRAFSRVCHQVPSRSFFLFGHPMAVCSRCLGFYLGFFIGCLLYPLTGRLRSPALPRLKTFILLSSPLAVDVLGNIIHLWRTAGAVRFLTGAVWSVILPFYLLHAVHDLLQKRKFGNTLSGQNSP